MDKVPNELLSIIFRYATLDDFSIQTTYDDPCVLATYRFTEYERSRGAVKTKSSISKACKHWNEVNARFLCEYVYIANSKRRDVLDGLARCLERKGRDERGAARGKWTKRVDICLDNFEHDWHRVSTYRDIKDGEASVVELYGWQHVLSLIENATVVSLFDGPNCAPNDWSTEVFFSLSNLPKLRRVEWDGVGSDMSDLQQLSVLCPSIVHIAFTLTASGGGDMDASTDAFEISFPQVQTLMLKWDQTEHPDHEYPPFQPWQLPNLRHLTYYLREYLDFRLARDLVRGFGDHLRSIELPVLGRNNIVLLPEDFFNLVPALEIFILDIFKTQLPASPTHLKIHTIGLRLRMNCSLVDITFLEGFHAMFSCSSFPALERVRIVHPHEFMDYAGYMTQPLARCWLNLMNDEDWVDVVTFDGHSLPISKEWTDHVDYEAGLGELTDEWEQ